jgi:outer membrane protein OmpA-like peptidoglycan-associated protein
MRRSALVTLIFLTLLVNAFAQNTAPAPTQSLTAAKRPKTDAEISQAKIAALMTTPTESDMYCSGFISQQAMPRNSFLAGGLNTPEEAYYSDRETVYLTGGEYQVGSKFAVMRQIRDLNNYEGYKSQRRVVASAGSIYQELGRVRVIDVQKNIAIATVELSCDPFNPGDLIIPWVDRPFPTYRQPIPITQVSRLVLPNGKLMGRIIGADAPQSSMLVTSKTKPYLNIGANQGVKAGDYFRVVRDYVPDAYDIDSFSHKATMYEMGTVKPAAFGKERLKEFPRRVLGELMVLYTTPTTATATVTRSLETMQVGDMVELMEEPPPVVAPPPPPMNAPTLTCSASPAAIHVGENSNIRCTGASADDRPLTYAWTTDNGAVNPRDNNAVLDGRNAHAGAANVTTTVTDDRNLTASAVTAINVEAAPVLEASKIGELNFKSNNAYVDNRSKAFLDDVALRLQREANSTAVMVGYTQAPEAARLGISRASNAKTYLVKEKGIDAGRIQVRDGGPGGQKVDVWFIPAGAAQPNIPEPAPAAK